MRASAPKIIDLTDDLHDIDPRTHQLLDPTPDDEPTVDVGAALRRARLRRRVSLVKAAEHTRISRAYLQALENGAPADRFPAPAYARFFLADYARFLGVDPAPLLRSFQIRQQRLEEPILQPLPEPGARSRKWTARVLVVVCSATLIGLVLDHYVSQKPQARLPIVTTGRAPLAAAGAGERRKATATRRPAFRGVNVTLRIAAPSWISAAADGRVVVRETLPAGRSLTLHAKRNLDLTLGNAGGVRMHVNGKRMTTGASGQVVHIQLRWEKGHVATLL